MSIRLIITTVVHTPISDTPSFYRLETKSCVRLVEEEMEVIDKLREYSAYCDALKYVRRRLTLIVATLLRI